jgi:hypothetical protein
MRDEKFKTHVAQCTSGCVKAASCDEWKTIWFDPEKAVPHRAVCTVCMKGDICPEGRKFIEEMMAGIVTDCSETSFAKYIVNTQVSRLL